MTVVHTSKGCCEGLMPSRKAFIPYEVLQAPLSIVWVKESHLNLKLDLLNISFHFLSPSLHKSGGQGQFMTRLKCNGQHHEKSVKVV